jgi:hypothetical protein
VDRRRRRREATATDASRAVRAVVIRPPPVLLPTWIAAAADRPCPVCAGAAGCAVDRDDPTLVLCLAVDSPLPAPGGGWIHALPRDVPPPACPPAPVARRAWWPALIALVLLLPLLIALVLR